MQNFSVQLDHRDQLHVEKKEDVYHFSATGCSRILQICLDLNQKKVSDPLQFELPDGSDHVSMLVRELLLKLQDKWDYPYKEEELCHCRAIPTRVVDQAIVSGVHRIEDIGKFCSAGVTCGNCRTDIEAIMEFRQVPGTFSNSKNRPK